MRLVSVRKTASSLTIEFTTTAGCRYQLERSDRLQPDAWTNVGSSIAGNGSIMTLTDEKVTNVNSQFYRIRIADCSAG